MKDFTHVTRYEGENLLHFSHLFQYVSAWEPSEERQGDLRGAILCALERAKKESEPQIVDQDGEMFFVVYPNEMISLCLRWKSYKIAKDDQS
jgi:hypothetical protein